MTFLKANRRVAELGIVPWQLLRKGPWGEIWRANREGGPTILVAVYCTPLGEKLFDEARPVLERWQKIAPRSCPHLIDIVEIGDRGVPYLFLHDPAGPSLREHVESLGKFMPLEEQATLAECIACGLQQAESFGFSTLGISPDTIFRATNDAGTPWKLLPVGPGAASASKALCHGRYFPPAYRHSSDSRLLHVDTYALSCILIEVWRRDFEAPWGPVKDIVAAPAWRRVIDTGLVERGGIHAEAPVMLTAILDWKRDHVASDLEAMENPSPSSGSPGKWILPLAVLLLFFGISGAALYLRKSYSIESEGKSIASTRQVAEHLATALASGNVEVAEGFFDEEARHRAGEIVQLVSSLQSLERPPEWIRAARIRPPHSDFYQLTVVDNLNEPLAEISLRFVRPPAASPLVGEIHYRQLRYPDNND